MILQGDLIASLVKSSELPKVKVVQLLKSFVDLVENNDVRVSGLGTFVWKKRKEREGRNPATGKAVTIPAHKRLSFKAARSMKSKTKEG